ncbi:ribosomal-protein-alanine N-acetyltransferase [Anaerovirgula multivorans]|uniref:Ribosomal-protein-alanine N-acetyltransferase n=1 Tax=Anaerovirgula multivorans TaxID=312168 RepID=A0A239APW7_9FIRM|nr:GNAT family N-acetyltransferase [Anaerovirgula multivorans]SNR97038.1 ribosomal-protein-alanine N-acetyltransferase [Anaerovirgula multivorans]
MYFDMVKALPKKALEDKDLDVKGLKVYLVQDFNLEILRRMVDFGQKIFGEAGMDEWGLVPQIRHGNVFVLKEDIHSKIVGMAILMRDWEDEKKCYLFDYAIQEELQGKGLGYHFLKVICLNLKEQGFDIMGLTVDIHNKPAIRLYKDKMGFVVEEMNKHEYGEGEHRYIMNLDLNIIK